MTPPMPLTGTTNLAILPALLISISVFCIYSFFLLPKQFQEIRRPRNWLTGLRWIIFALIAVAVITSIPSIIYQTNRFLGTDTDMQQNVVGITSNLSRLAGAILLVFIYTYKQKGDD